jgi:hypothetical protein
MYSPWLKFGIPLTSRPPEMDKLVNVPKLVMLGWLAPVTVVAVLADDAKLADPTVPDTFPPGKLLNPAPEPLN